jgi:hypothetical protein
MKEATDGRNPAVVLNNHESSSAVRIWTRYGQTVRYLRGRRGQNWGYVQAARCAVNGMRTAGGITGRNIVQPTGGPDESRLVWTCVLNELRLSALYVSVLQHWKENGTQEDPNSSGRTNSILDSERAKRPNAWCYWYWLSI